MRTYYYNSLGTLVGSKRLTASMWLGGSSCFVYDGLGRRIHGCDDGGGWTGYDGHNPIKVKEGYNNPTWRFVHGPGTDDPLVGLHFDSPSYYDKYYYLTDGRGRQLAFTDSLGTNKESDQIYWREGGNQAGGIVASHGFDNSRATAGDLPQLSFYRNRYYDQTTGRFLQEDPIGVAGGLNLYQYSSNNPVAYTDPFGLKVCFLGGEEQIRELKRGTEDATNTIVLLDRKNCVAKWEPRGREGFEEIQSRFGEMVSASTVFKVRFAGLNEGSWFQPLTNTARVRRNDIGFPYFVGIGATCTVLTGRFTLGAILAHEFVGHGYGVLASGEPANQVEATRIENLYHSGRNERTRCLDGGI
jgi:RHS repeat-associated protein